MANVVKKLFQNNPMLYIALPFMLGIAFAWHTGISPGCCLSLLAISFIFTIASFFIKKVRWLFAICAVSTLFITGALSLTLSDKKASPAWSEETGIYTATLLEMPTMNSRTAKAAAIVTRLGRDSIRTARREGVANLYFQRCVEVEELKAGSIIHFEGKVNNPKNNGNPAEFDTEHYYYTKGITGLCYLPVYGWREQGTAPLDIKTGALLLREKISGLYAKQNFKEKERAVISALTIGDKREINEELRSTFSASGAGHLLALSGLHLGILYIILSTLLPKYKSRRLFSIIREIFILALLWCFAFIAGLSPSITRAAILFSLLSLTRIIQRDSSSINSLAFAAFAMLLYEPHYLFDISFQLSFSAVFAILLLAEPLTHLLRGYNYGRIYRYFAEIIAVSIAAQIGTIPFAWYHIGIFSPYFLLTNIVAIPLSFIIMMLSVLLWCTAPANAVCSLIATLLSGVTLALNHSLQFIESLPGSVINLPHIEFLDTLLLIAAILFITYSALQRSLGTLIIGCCSALTLAGILLHRQYTRSDEPYIIFYNNSRTPTAQIVTSSRDSYIFTSQTIYDAEYEHLTTPLCLREDISEPILLHEGESNENVAYENGIITFAGCKIKIFCNDYWCDDTGTTPLHFAYICEGFLGSIKELIGIYPAKHVIFDATLHHSTRTRLINECKKQNIPYTDINESGAMRLRCNRESIVLEKYR